MTGVCSIDGCGEPRRAKGWCRRHYYAWKRNGDPLKRLRSPQGGGQTNHHGYRLLGNKSEHKTIAERALGKPLPPKAQVHHVDENRANNAPTNLVICPNNAYHHLLHKRMRARAACGNPNFRKCFVCKAWDDPVNMSIYGNASPVHRLCINAYHAKRKRAAKPQPTVSA